ncbi:MAG: Flp pilus assembly protein TadD, partial [Paraglaciecola sp.]
ECLTAVEAVLVLAPDNSEARISGFYSNLHLKNFAACQTLLDDLHELGFWGADLDRLRGELLIAQGQFDNALPYLKKAQASNTKSWRLLERIGAAYLNSNEWTKAEKTFYQALELNPDFAMAYNGLGIALSKQKQHEEAAKAFMHSLGLLYHQPEIHLNLGLTLAAVGQSQQAQQALNNALAIRPEFENARTALKQVQHSIAKAMLLQI